MDAGLPELLVQVIKFLCMTVSWTVVSNDSTQNHEVLGFLRNSKFSPSCSINSVTPFCRELTVIVKLYSSFMQETALSHTGNTSVNAVEQVFGRWVIAHGLCPLSSQDFKHCDYCLWGDTK
jgi:hypothetical protein